MLRQTCAKMSNFITDSAFINGRWVKVSTTFPVFNPYSGSVVGHAADCNEKDVQSAITFAQEAFLKWKSTYAKERSGILRKWMDLILENKQQIAELITLENGKPITQSLGEINYAVTFVEWCAEEAKRTYGMTIPSPHPRKRLMSIQQPIGVAGLITPWNFPCAMITRKACAAIAAGCSVVVKPSEDTPFSALAIAKLAQEAGLPDGVLNVLPSSRQNAPKIGEAICNHPDVGAISFTGSTATGKLLLSYSAATVKKVSLELGGMSPFIVFNGADIDNAVEQAMLSKFRNMGQACVASNRFYVQEEVHDEFVEKLMLAMKDELKLGDPNDPAITFGPLINENAVLKMEGQIADAINQGAKVEVGGTRSSLGGTFFEPTLIANVKPEMQCFREETFGPIASVMRFETEDEVIALANNCRVGLAGYIFSNNVQQCWRVSERLEVGMVGINEGFLSLVEGPFGGVKESGLGREGSRYGLEEFMETKYLCWRV